MYFRETPQVIDRSQRLDQPANQESSYQGGHPQQQGPQNVDRSGHNQTMHQSKHTKHNQQPTDRDRHHKEYGQHPPDVQMVHGKKQSQPASDAQQQIGDVHHVTSKKQQQYSSHGHEIGPDGHENNHQQQPCAICPLCQSRELTNDNSECCAECKLCVCLQCGKAHNVDNSKVNIQI